MPDRDLFGDPIPKKRRGRRKKTKQRGYAAPPGTGPVGETCGSCRFIYRAPTGRYRKCILVRPHWTGGIATDILARSLSCWRWKEEDKHE